MAHHTINGATLAALGIESCLVTTTSRGNDEMVVEMARAADASWFFAPYTTAVLADPAGTVRFRGVMLQPQAIADGGTERHAYTFTGPWHWLERIVFQQPWTMPTDASDYESGTHQVQLSRVILNQKIVSGEPAPMSVRDQVIEVLDCAIAAGAPIAYSATNLPDDVFPPEDEQTDLFCADALEAQMRWATNLTCHWDYTTNPPTLRFVAAGTARTAALEPPWQSINPRPRYDLLVNAVRLTFLQVNVATHTVDDHEQTRQWAKLTSQNAVADNGSPFEVAQLIELRGSSSATSSTTLRQRVKVEELGASPDAAEMLTWMAGPVSGGYRTGGKCGALYGVKDLAFMSGGYPWLDVPEGAEEAFSNTNFRNELQEGAIADWMSGVKAWNVTGHCRVKAKFVTAWDGEGLPTAWGEEAELALDFSYTRTDAVTRTYSTAASSDTEEMPGEEIPVGLASALLAGYRDLYWDMTLRRVDDEVNWTALPSDRWSITGTAASGAQSISQVVRRDLFSGTTEIQCGPPTHLGLDQILELVRKNRTRRLARASGVRASGKMPAGQLS